MAALDVRVVFPVPYVVVAVGSPSAIAVRVPVVPDVLARVERLVAVVGLAVLLEEEGRGSLPGPVDLETLFGWALRDGCMITCFAYRVSLFFTSFLCSIGSYTP